MTGPTSLDLAIKSRLAWRREAEEAIALHCYEGAHADFMAMIFAGE